MSFGVTNGASTEDTCAKVALITPLDPVPEPSVFGFDITMVGAEEYPTPPCVIVVDAIVPLVVLIVKTPVLPSVFVAVTDTLVSALTPVITKVGADVYPLPALPIFHDTIGNVLSSVLLL